MFTDICLEQRLGQVQPFIKPTQRLWGAGREWSVFITHKPQKEDANGSHPPLPAPFGKQFSKIAFQVSSIT